MPEAVIVSAVRTPIGRANKGVLQDVRAAIAVRAAQTLSVVKAMGIDEEKLNPHGGAIALGHPLGCSGARIIATLINDLQTHNKTFGIATLCIGGGQGLATIIERMS